MYRTLLGVTMLAVGLFASHFAEAAPPVTVSLLDHGKWVPTPVRTVAELPNLKPVPAEALSRYGGWKDHRVEATGFFRVEKLEGRWWLVDPEGCLFLSVGLCSVNREGVNPDLTVADRRFGNRQNWADETAALLWSHGFNSLGCWSDHPPFLAGKRPLPYFPRWNFMSTYKNQRNPKLGPKGYPNDCMPLFDDEFVTFCDQHAKQLAASKDDPFLVGHFSDNELPFRPNLLDLYLEVPETDSGHRAARKWLTEHRAASGRPAAATITQEERDGFLEFAARRYYSVVNAAIKRYDPNHLYVGSRIHGRCIRPATFRGATDVDLVSVNYYHRWSAEHERMSGWVEASGRPFLISEWYAQSLDSADANASGAGFRVRSQRDRGLFYQNLALGLLEHPGCVGWHWFKYGGDGPDCAKGIVDTQYNPHQEFLSVMQELNQRVYPLARRFR